MKKFKLLTLVLFLIPFLSYSQQWNFDLDKAKKLKSVVINHEEQYVLGNGLQFTKNGKDIIHENLAVFFSMDAYSQREYLNRVSNFWKSDLNITSVEFNKLTTLINAWHDMRASNGGDQNVLNATKDLASHATTPALKDLISASGTDQLTNEIPIEPFEINQTAVTMAGLWGGFIGAGLVAVAGSILKSFTPNFLADAVSSLIDYSMKAGVFIGKKLAQGVSIAGQWIGHGLKKIFGKNGKGKKGKVKKSFMPLPGEQGDCCGLPYPLFY